jgi:hypothetical protein
MLAKIRFDKICIGILEKRFNDCCNNLVCYTDNVNITYCLLYLGKKLKFARKILYCVENSTKSVENFCITVMYPRRNIV